MFTWMVNVWREFAVARACHKAFGGRDCSINENVVMVESAAELFVFCVKVKSTQQRDSLSHVKTSNFWSVCATLNFLFYLI